MTTASAATTQNDTRQCENCRIAAPSSGPTTGAIPATPAITFIARTSRAPEVRSTTIDDQLAQRHADKERR
jgi:hypothetical protein